MSNRRHKLLYWLFKLLSIVVSCALPIWAICEKFPIWTFSYGTVRSVGVGGILVLIVILFIWRRSVFEFIRDRLKLKHAPSITIPFVLLIISYILEYIGNFTRDLQTVFWMWIIGCAIGTVLTFIAENCFGKKEAKNDE